MKNYNKEFGHIIYNCDLHDYKRLTEYLMEQDIEFVKVLQAVMYLGDDVYSNFEEAYVDITAGWECKESEIRQMCSKGENCELFISLLKRGYRCLNRAE